MGLDSSTEPAAMRKALEALDRFLLRQSTFQPAEAAKSLVPFFL
jgi:hypothetical protein